MVSRDCKCGSWEKSVSFKAILGIADQMYKATDPDAVFETFLDYAKSLGLDYLFIGRWGFLLSHPQGTPEFFRSNMSDWAKVYFDNGYFHVDPCIHLAMRINRAFFYKEAFVDLTPAQEKFVEHAREHGLVDGFVVPIHRRLGAPGAVTMGGKAPLNISKIDCLRLEMLSHMAYGVIDELQGTDQQLDIMRLTDRERTVLTLVARGKTNWEVGAILSISEYSVRDYLKSLSKKLQTANRTHTVVRAMQLGLISP